MRRKVRPALPGPALPRALVPAVSASRLPTAAALALALAGLGCSAPTQEAIVAEPLPTKPLQAPTSQVAPTPTTGSAPLAPPIEPDPVDVDGEIPAVTPVPVKPPPPTAPPAPSTKPPKLGGKPMAAHPSI